jgi:protein involved in polysaccharide export with SLBB domain
MCEHMRHPSLYSKRTRVLGVIALSAIFGGTVFAQSSQTKDPFSLSDRKGTINLPDIFQLPAELKEKEVPRLTAKEVPLDAPVIPDEYFVGPGDVLALNIWSSSPAQQELTVTPEGTLLIKNVGSVSARDITLEALKKNVSELTNKKYPGAGVTLTLISPRKVSVEVVGQVFNEGTFEMYSVQRASDLILKANELIPGQTVKNYYEKTLPKLKREASERKILVKHRGGSVDRVDLVKYRVSHQGRCNPYLREGDIVYVPEREDRRNSIAVFGGANKFGGFEFVPGDSLKDLIMMGYGFKSTADSEHARFTRLSTDGARMDTAVIDAPAVIEGRARNIALVPGDRVFIPERHDDRANYFAAVQGEVVQPGHYPITKNSTRLSELIRNAGGFTTGAFLRGAVLIRVDESEAEVENKIEEEQLLGKRSSDATQDSSYYLVETELRAKGDHVSVDFYRLFVLGDSTQDVVLQSSDKIFVPRRRGTVFVFGQVGAPGLVPLVEGEGYDFYVEKAGGFTEGARKGDVKIIKSGTRVWLNPGETTVEDGDYVWVPKEPHYPFSYYVTTYSQLASIIAMAATVALVVVTIRNR